MARVLTLSLLVLMATISNLRAEEPMMEFPKPTKQHEMLQKFVGEWESEGECMASPESPMPAKGKETVRTLGGFWIMSEMKNEMGGMQMTGIMTLGYNTEKKKFVGTWIDSVTETMWQYEGDFDEKTKTLTLNTEGPNMMEPGKKAKFKDEIQFTDENTKQFSSSMQQADGTWVTFMKMTSKRKGK